MKKLKLNAGVQLLLNPQNCKYYFLEVILQDNLD
jgi:hypothetical protein